jgi:hypothetical protein
MIDGKKVVAWTPYGREETMSILVKYMERDVMAGVVDEYHLYMNTDPDQVRDREYAQELNEEHAWIVLQERPAGLKVLRPKQLNTGRYYRYAIEPDTVYVRLDDDIVYVHENAMERLVQRKIGSPSLVCFPIIWHNAICSYYLQTFGKIPTEFGVVEEPYCMDQIGWKDAGFAESIHNLLLDHIQNDTVDSLFFHHDIELPIGKQFSVSCFAAESDIYRELNPQGILHHEEEEHWHTVYRTKQTGRSNSIVGNSLVAHLSFFPHRDYIRGATDILPRYRELAENLQVTNG